MSGASLLKPRSASTPASRVGETPDQTMARRLVREFNAPVGLLDPTTLSWLARVGLEDALFPDADATLTASLASGVYWHGRVSPWRPGRDSGPIWLCLPVPRPEGHDLLALVGFQAQDGEPAEGFGPACPERALRAWGQSVADDLRGEAFPRPIGVAAGRPDGSERLLIARLIRRMRISDPPEQFQELALRAAREALRVDAVAWVPRSLAETIVVAGGVEGMKPRDFRALVPDGLEQSVWLANGAAVVPGSAQAASRRVVVVASEAQTTTGWIVAVDPTDGRPFAAAEIEVLQPLASLIGTQRVDGRLYRDLKEMLFGIIRALTAAIDAKDPYTSGHSERVARIAVRLAEELGMPVSERGDLYLMGLLHDVGKIGVDDDVLKKTGALTPDEYRKIQDHVKIGVRILSDLKKLRHLLPGVASHHEAFDGKGYPVGLSGTDIPWVARILAVADSFDAMSSTRPYRNPLLPLKIDGIFRSGAGGQWDPAIVDALFACRGDLEQIRQKGLGVSLVAAVDDMVNKFK
jgi:HD-GYP domain-containing protein (c-di-GMP phosphodiesterase class II)